MFCFFKKRKETDLSNSVWELSDDTNTLMAMDLGCSMFTDSFSGFQFFTPLGSQGEWIVSLMGSTCVHYWLGSMVQFISISLVRVQCTEPPGMHVAQNAWRPAVFIYAENISKFTISLYNFLLHFFFLNSLLVSLLELY